MGNLDQFLSGLLHIPEDEILPADVDLTPYYQRWGFTIYRTEYGPSSDEHWQALLNAIHTGVVDQVTGTDGNHSGDPVAQQILSLFRLDARSDAELLSGLDMDRVRKLYQDETGGEPMNAKYRTRRYLLLVDGDVIREHDATKDMLGSKNWVKCVEVDYIASDHIPRNTRLGGQRYFGWMKTSTKSVSQLWSLLGLRWLSELAPSTVWEQMLEVWHEEGDL